MTIQEIDQAATRRIRAAREPLIAALTAAAQGKPWHYLLFGSLARGTARRGSDADIAILDAGERRAEAERAAWEACKTLGLKGDVMLWEDLADYVRARAEREGVRCGA